MSDMVEHKEEKKKTAYLVAGYTDHRKREEAVEHLDELALLCDTCGLEVVGKNPCRIRKYDASTFLSQGKIEELNEELEHLSPDNIVFDDEITPAQQRNLEGIFKTTVLDRTEVILAVFAQRAHSKEAHLQVELAQEEYLAPRLKRMWTHLSRQAGSVGGAGAYLKGTGEKQIEVDRRLIQKRIHQLQQQLKEVRENRKVQRAARERAGVPCFALVGYTNAGKSTLLNALSDAEVFTEDKLFATLDTTTRKLILPNNQEAVLIDTVGFIRKLPHQVVEAFKSTLEEAVYADILLHVIDASHPAAEEQAATTLRVLKELGAADKPVITILNKCDKEAASLAKLRFTYPKTVQVSALNREGFDRLLEMMKNELQKQRETVNLRIPQSEYRHVSEALRSGNLLFQEYEGNDVLLRIDLPKLLVQKLQKYIEKGKDGDGTGSSD